MSEVMMDGFVRVCDGEVIHEQRVYTIVERDTFANNSLDSFNSEDNRQVSNTWYTEIQMSPDNRNQQCLCVLRAVYFGNPANAGVLYMLANQESRIH